MQNAGFRAAGLDATYVAIPCVAADLPGVMRALARQGGGGNVTLPHKGLAATVGRPDARVARIGVANVFVGSKDGLHVGNTDVDGVLALVVRLGPPRRRWVVVGTGGSARAIAAAAGEAGASLAVISREPGRQRSFEEVISTLGVEVGVPEEADLLLNATPVGLAPDDAAPVDLGRFPAVRAVADLTYRPTGMTALVRAASDAGLAAIDGREMLLIQGAAAWQWWFPGVQAPVEVMRAALEGHLG
jgi:shikimate dehydrogenase